MATSAPPAPTSTTSTAAKRVMSSRNVAQLRAEYESKRAAEVAAQSVLEDIGEMNRAMDTERWKKRVGLASGTKVFIITGCYPDFRDALLRRGWKQNPDTASPHFDMKFTLKSNEIDHRALQPHQQVNHISRASHLTTKAGLLHTLRQAHHFDNVDQFTFYPRAYDLADQNDYADFADDFRCVEAEKMLREVAVRVLNAVLHEGVMPPEAVATGSSSAPVGGVSTASEPPFARLLHSSRADIRAKLDTPQMLNAIVRIAESVTINQGVLDVALAVCGKRTHNWDDADLDDPSREPMRLVEPAEWEVLRYCNAFEPGGPVEVAERRIQLEEAARDLERRVNQRRDRLVRRLKKRGLDGDATVVTAVLKAAEELGASSTTGATKSAGEGLPGLPSGIPLDILASDDDPSDGEESGDDADDESDNDDGSDGSDAPRGRRPAAGLRRKASDDADLDGKHGHVPHRDRGAVSATQLRMWRDRLAKDGGDVGVFSDTLGNPTATVSATTVSSLANVCPITTDHWTSIVRLIGALNDLPSSQSPLVATVPRNVWIIKPAGKSRGRGIECESSLAYILNQRGSASHRESAWIVQKYIERPLLIKGLKWDIRQWVLVSSYNPLTVWFYDRCYLRFCCYPFELDNLSNKYVHLSNNSIQKHSAAFDVTSIEGNMWHVENFSEWLQDRAKEGAWDGLTYVPDTASMAGNCNAPQPDTNEAPAPLPIGACTDIWHDVLQPQLRRIVCWSLQAAQDKVQPRQGSYEIFGYDFMIDADLHPWLIEINSSPDFSYSTPVTELLVKAASEDAAKVLVDYADWESECAALRAERRKERAATQRQIRPSAAAGTDASAEPDLVGLPGEVENPAPGKLVLPPRPDTGGWQLIFKSAATLPRTLTCTAHDLACVGTGIRVPAGTRRVVAVDAGVRLPDQPARSTRAAASVKVSATRAVQDPGVAPIPSDPVASSGTKRDLAQHTTASSSRRPPVRDSVAPDRAPREPLVRFASGRLASAGTRIALGLGTGAVQLGLPSPTKALPAERSQKAAPRHSAAGPEVGAQTSRFGVDAATAKAAGGTRSGYSSRTSSKPRGRPGDSNGYVSDGGFPRLGDLREGPTITMPDLYPDSAPLTVATAGSARVLHHSPRKAAGHSAAGQREPPRTRIPGPSAGSYAAGGTTFMGVGRSGHVDHSRSLLASDPGQASVMTHD